MPSPEEILLDPAAVDAAARVVAAQIHSAASCVAELTHLVADALADQDEVEQARRLVSLLGAFAEISYVSIQYLATAAREDETETLKNVVDAVHAWREESKQE